MKKTFSVATSILLLVGLLSAVFYIQLVKAKPGTIYIRANGLVEGTDKIQRVGDVYTFIDNIYDSIVVERSNIIIDGNGYVLQGSGSGNGFELQGITNVTIKNINIERFNQGVYFYNSPNNNILGNNITNNNDGIRLSNSLNNSIIGNIISTNIAHGILLQASSGSNVSRNTFIDNGLLLYDSYQNSIENNIVNGKPLVYLEGMSDYIVDNAGQVILVRCNNIRIRGLNLSRTGVGVELLETSNCIISGNNIEANNYDGIRLYSSSNNIISENNITKNNQDGIYFFSSLGNTILRNSITANSNYGIRMFSSSGNTLSGNNIAENNKGGIYLSYSSGNSIYHNNFIDNINQASLVSSGNVWDDGYPSGGNYWSDYSGVDASNDGIGDTPYTIATNNIDHYPLIAVFKTFNAGTWNDKTYYVDIVSNSTIANLDFNPYASPKPTLSFDVEGAYSIAGFARVAIPKDIMWCDNLAEWTITVGGNLTAAETILEDGNNTYIYFTYTHSIKTVQITSTHAVPEAKQFLMLPLLIIVTLLATILRKRRHTNKPQV